MAEAVFRCPDCGSRGQFYKDGWRDTRNGQVQRFLCRKCGFRFSNPNSLNVKDTNNRISRQNISRGMVLAALEKTRTSAGEISQTQQGLIVEFQWKMKKVVFRKEQLKAEPICLQT